MTVLDWNRGRLAIGEDLDKLLRFGRVQRETLVDGGLTFERRLLDQGYVYFLLNSGKSDFAGWISLATPAQAAAIFDPMSGARGMAALRQENSRAEVYLQLASGEALFVRTFASPKAGRAWKYWQASGPTLSLSGKWAVKFLKGGPALPAALEISELKSWTEFSGDAGKAFAGTAGFTLAFPRPVGDSPAWRLDLGQVAESARVRLNGREIAGLIQAPFRVIITRNQLKSINKLEVVVTNLSVNRIADLDRRDPNWKRFYNTNYPARLAGNRGPDGNFSAAKWAERPSGLLGPVALVPLSAMNP